MDTFTGTGRLIRLVARLERIRLAVWVAAIGLLPIVVGGSFASLYPSEAERAELAGTVASSPAFIGLLGPINGTSVGALTAWRMGTIGATLIAFMAAFAVIRHTRADEEEGRSELLGSTVVGRLAAPAAALAGAVAAGLAIGVLTTLGLVVLGESSAGALALGLGWFLVAVVFAALGVLAAQVAVSAGGARAVAGTAIGVAFLLRLAGDGAADSGLGWLSWLSPIGWTTKMAPFGAERWWVAALFVASAAVAVVVAAAMLGRRDLGGGVVTPRPGPAAAAPGLHSAFGLARRLQTRALVGWVVGIAAFATVWGVLADTINDLLEENPQLAEIFEAFGGTGQLTDAFFGAAFGILAVIISAYAISSVLVLHREEDRQRAEHVLATPTPRLRWAAGHLAFAFAAPLLLLLVAAVTSGAAYGITLGDLGNVFVSVDSALVQLPAVWVTAALAVALYGFVPRQVGFAWGILVVFLLLGQLGPILELPQWTLNLSPFTHVPAPPAPVQALPLVVMSALAAATTAAGLVGLRRRDIA